VNRIRADWKIFRNSWIESTLNSNITVSLKQRWIIFLYGLFLAFIRNPNFFIKPRIWSEEGSVYLKAAYLRPFWDAFFEAHEFGYFNLYTNLSTLIARYAVSLENVPYVTLFFSFLVIAIPILLISFGDSDVWDQGYKRVGLITLFLFIQPGIESWLTLISSQYYFGIITFVVLLMDFKNIDWKHYVLLGPLLLIATLSGVMSCIVIPFYLYKGFIEKNKSFMFLSIPLMIGLLIQIQVFFVLIGNSTCPPSVRFANVGFPLLSFTIMAKNIITPVAGLKIANEFGSIIRPLFEDRGILFYLALSFTLIFQTFFFMFLIKNLNKKIKKYGIILLFLIVIINVCTMLPPKLMAISGIGMGRYFLFPNFIMLVALFMVFQETIKDIYRDHSITISRFVFSFLFFLSIINGLGSYRINNHQFRHSPDWRKEAALFKNNPKKQSILIWGQGHWEIKLR